MESDGLEEIVRGLRAPDAVCVAAGVRVIKQVVEIDHLLCAVADVVVLRCVVAIHALFGGFVPVAGEECGGDADFFCGGFGVCDHGYFLFLFVCLSGCRFCEINVHEPTAPVHIYF